MKIAVFADIHGNRPAFEAVWADIEQQQVDLYVCAGDVINPFPWSRDLWEHIRTLDMPLLLGNHEEYVSRVFAAAEDDDVRHDVRFMPVRYTARQFEPDVVAEIAALPMTLHIPGPQGDDLLICHGSPTETRASFFPPLDTEQAAAWGSSAAKVMVGAHIHHQRRLRWRDKVLLTCGSVGLSLDEAMAAEYTILRHQNGSWQIDQRAVPYDVAAAARQIAETGFLTETGPIGWLFFDEMQSTHGRLVDFFQRYVPQTWGDPPPFTETEWTDVTRSYLQTIGRWAAVSRWL